MEESNQRKAFEQFVEKARNEMGKSLKKLFLYGSVARKEETKDSDIDILAVVEKEEQKEKLQNIAFEIGIQEEVSFSPIVKTEKEYEQLKDTIYGKEVRSTGEIHV